MEKRGRKAKRMVEGPGKEW